MFAIPTRTRYGLRALIRIASHDPGKPLPLGLIAREEKLSIKYLENIFRLLKRSGIVNSTRGPEGGYRLARPAEKLSLYEIIDAIDGPISTVDCLHPRGGGCGMVGGCRTQGLWKELLVTIESFLKDRTLADLVADGLPNG
jgi:Rrf2 family protein